VFTLVLELSLSLPISLGPIAREDILGRNAECIALNLLVKFLKDIDSVARLAEEPISKSHKIVVVKQSATSV
jgi:hypothetical protein